MGHLDVSTLHDVLGVNTFCSLYWWGKKAFLGRLIDCPFFSVKDWGDRIILRHQLYHSNKTCSTLSVEDEKRQTQ